MENYLYKKEFCLLNTGGLFLNNPQEMLKYVEEKANLLINAKSNEELLNIKINILEEFNKIAKYDEKNSNVPEPFGEFKSEQEKENFIKKHIFVDDFVYYLGNIFLNYHESLLKNKDKITLIDEHVFYNSIVRYDELYNCALNEYLTTLSGKKYEEIIEFPHRKKINKKSITMVDYRGTVFPIENDLPNDVPNPITDEHSYGATFILPALIERFLIIQIDSILIHNAINKITELLENKAIMLTEKEAEYYNIFKLKGNKTFFKSENDIRTNLYAMFTKYNVIEDNDDMKLMFFKEYYVTKEGKKELKKLTLGSIINSQYAKSIIKKQYFKLLNILFSTNELNIRNNIAHGNNQNIDYLCIGITSVMMQLLWDIISRDIFK